MIKALIYSGLLNWFCLSTGMPQPVAQAIDNASTTNVWLAELQRSVSERGRAVQSFRVEGVVCAIVRERKLIAIQDSSAAALFELPAIDGEIRPGEWLAIEADNSSLARGRYGIKIGADLIVENDGIHSARVISRSTYLTKGMKPVRLEYFNAGAPAVLKLEYEGPGISRQPIPESVLWHNAAAKVGETNFEPGVKFAAYVSPRWFYLPDFTRLRPVAEGRATNFALLPCVREENSALTFIGYLEIKTPGVYSFHLESDDGSRLTVAEPNAGYRMIPLDRKSNPVVGNLEQLGENQSRWVAAEGFVSFAGEDEMGVQLELEQGGNAVPVTVLGELKSVATNLLGQHLRVTGMAEVSRAFERQRSIRLLAPGATQVEVLPGGLNFDPTAPVDTLTTAVEVRRLKAEEARQPRRARLRGVITWKSPVAVVLQDGSGGVFIHMVASPQPQRPEVGDAWEIEGTTGPGDWSPVLYAEKAIFLGHAPLPEPIPPTWDQLMNGSLDAQYVEIRGVLSAISTNEMTVLTGEGKLKILSNRERPLPRVPCSAGDAGSPVGSLIRIRGCLTAEIDWAKGQVKPGRVYISPSTVSVDEPYPSDPFAIALRRAADLLLFDARARALQRTKLAGQILHARPGEYFAQDNQTGFRVLTESTAILEAGDLIEAVGFAKLGAPSPLLQEAQIRKTGHAPLPAPTPIRGTELLDRNLDAKLIQIEAVLVSSAIQHDEQIFEVQAGASRFLARLKASSDAWSSSIAPGSRLSLTGVYASPREDRSGSGPASFELLLNSAAAISVLQQPPWWTVRRALTVAGGFAGALGVAFIWISLLRRKVEQRTVQLQQEIEERQHIEQRRAMEQERARVAHDLHDELGAGLTEMGILGALAKNPEIPSVEKDRYLDQLTESARSLVTGLDEIVWAINPQYDSVGSLATYYSLFAERFLNLAGITCRLSVAESFPDYPLESKVRHDVFLAFKEALNNVVRHSGATEVELQIQVAHNELGISIRDNGRGLEPLAASAPGSDGLAGMRERLRQLGGACEIDSQPGGGTSVQFKLSLNGVSHDQSRHR